MSKQTNPKPKKSKTNQSDHKITTQKTPGFKPGLSLSVQYADPRLKDIVTRSKIRLWTKAALRQSANLTVRFVDAEEGRILNRDYRNKDKATNVLTFQYDSMPNSASEIDREIALADIILCTDVLREEALAQNKSIEAHAAHLLVHGVLHAQNFDHKTDAQAKKMETLETGILIQLGFPDPYLTK